MPDTSMLTSSAALPWRDGTGRLRVTAIVKVTYQLRAGGLATPAPPLPLFEDTLRDPAYPGSPVTASDFAPLKLHTDVLVTGHFHPSRPGSVRQLVELAVARGAEVALSRRLVAVGARLASDSWMVMAGMAPCEDVEESLASPRGWLLPVPAKRVSASPGRQSQSPTVDAVSLENLSGFVIGKVAWSPEPGKARRTVVVKMTLDLPASGGAATVAPEQSSLRGDEYTSEEEDAPLTYPSDHAPLKPRADILLRGTAHAGPGKNSALVSLSLGSLEARVAALAPRTWGSGGLPVAAGSFEPVPLTYEHALGGPGFAANPVGTGIQDGTAPPRIEDPDRLMRTRADRPRPAATGPISPAWAARQKLAGTFHRDWQLRRWP